jgi:hypothetical protein
MQSRYRRTLAIPWIVSGGYSLELSCSPSIQTSWVHSTLEAEGSSSRCKKKSYPLG